MAEPFEAGQIWRRRSDGSLWLVGGKIVDWRTEYEANKENPHRVRPVDGGPWRVMYSAYSFRRNYERVS